MSQDESPSPERLSQTERQPELRWTSHNNGRRGSLAGFIFMYNNHNIIMPALFLLFLLHSGGTETAFALVGVGTRGGFRHLSRQLRNPSRRTYHYDHDKQYYPPLLHPSPCAWSIFSSTVDTFPESPGANTKEMALQLMEENAMLPMNDNIHNSDFDDMNHPLGSYDEDDRSPIETEFMSLMSPFLSYTEGDIQSLTTTSTRYLHYHPDSHHKSTKKPRHRSKEEGIRYRTLYSGVQAASLDPEVIRAFAVLFEDFLPIRLAGRRIYGHLNKIMEEVQEERMGEITRACEICPNWDFETDGGDNAIEYSRTIWDTIMDEALLLEHSLESAMEGVISQEGGVVSLFQMIQLGMDKVLIEEGLVENKTELECLLRRIALEDDIELLKQHNPRKARGLEASEQDENYLEMTFPIFMKLLYESTKPTNKSIDYLILLMQKLEKRASDHRASTGNAGKDTSTLLAAKAVLSGSSNSCKKRQKYSDRFDEYVSTFNVWEEKFLGNTNSEIESQQSSRRMEILRGCFVGARNEKNAAALKIVYMDYAALRVGGDLIFQLMSKIANKIL